MAQQWVLKHKLVEHKIPRVLKKVLTIYSVEAISYSQNSEDMMFFQLIQGTKQSGFYVDIGAHHPIRFSNTYLLYTSGWGGINIDPLLGTKELFDRYRPDDINLELAVGSCSGKVTYYSFEEPAYNTTSEKYAKKVVSNNWSKMISKDIVEVEPLEQIFDKYVTENGHIDLLTLDVETKEMDVLKSNNWEKYIPDWIIVEALDAAFIPLGEINKDRVVSFLREKGYEPIAKNRNSVLLKYLKDNK